MPTSRVLRLAAFGVLLVAGAACRRTLQPGGAPSDSVRTVVPTTAGSGMGADSPVDSAGAGSDTTARLDDSTARAVAEVRNALLAPVYFDYDRAELSDQTRAALEQKVAVLKQYTGVRVRVAGHTDARGSDEYNLALGQRRAATVMRYMASRGVPSGRLELVSYGEERPSAEGDDESARAQNRRAEFELVAGADFTTTSSSPASP